MSAYNADRGVIFVHVPKTAGTSMDTRPWLNGSDHLPARYYQEAVAEFDEVFKFAFVRSPWDRLVSAFFHNPNDILPYPRTRDGFHQFAVAMARDGIPAPEACGQRHPLLVPQWEFVCDESGEILVDFVGRYEKLRADWGTVCQRFDVPDDLPRLQQSQHENYKAYYTPETWAGIGNVYQRDIEMFGYG